ncbi:TOBE domain-containing protein, partial [Pseudooctadecabacter sp.]|uniref:TOBE domain-containing protein n=1 Tax=Pseudooctadecabacter sp. TaxID=1966338 RepID=UPI0025DD1ACB
STMIYVTHDQVEAMTLATRIVVLDALKDNGYSHSIAQVGTPLELYETPENEFVARFIGSPAMNLMPGEIVETGDRTGVKIDEGSGITYSNIKTTDADKGMRVNVGIRPEDFVAADGADYAFAGTVEIAEALGEVTLLYFETPKSDEDTNAVIAKMPGIHKSMRGQAAQLTADPAKVHLFANGKSLYYR